MSADANNNIRRPKQITNTGYILQITEKTLFLFLRKIKKGHTNTIYLNKYLIKIICLSILYSYNKITISFLSPIVLENLKTLLFTPNEFTLPNDAINVLTKYLNDIFNYYVYRMQKDKRNNNNNNNFVRVDTTNIDNQNINFKYKVIDYSSKPNKSIKRINNNKKLGNEEMFKPSLLYIYFLERMDTFYVLAGEDNTNFGIMQKLILNSFVNDCMFDRRNFRGFTRYVSKNNTNQPPTANTQRVHKLRFTNSTKKYNGPTQTHKSKNLNNTNNT
jgi:hypothetical protein